AATARIQWDSHFLGQLHGNREEFILQAHVLKRANRVKYDVTRFFTQGDPGKQVVGQKVDAVDDRQGIKTPLVFSVQRGTAFLQGMGAEGDLQNHREPALMGPAPEFFNRLVCRMGKSRGKSLR